jgi:hypothetical protein
MLQLLVPLRQLSHLLLLMAPEQAQVLFVAPAQRWIGVLAQVLLVPFEQVLVVPMV